MSSVGRMLELYMIIGLGVVTVVLFAAWHAQGPPETPWGPKPKKR